MAKPKFDYDSDKFYNEIYTLAFQGYNDKEIAYALGESIGSTFDPETFSCMKNGNYIGWNEEQNKARSERILKELARGRNKINAIVRGAYLKAALGGRKTKNITRISRPIYDENGSKIGDQEVQTSESEFEAAPNIQALSTWLYQHDPEWRRVQRGEPDPEEQLSTDNGLNIEAWIAKEHEATAPSIPTDESAD